MWRQNQIDSNRISIQKELDDIREEFGNKTRLSHCLEQISHLSGSQQSEGRIRCLLYGMFALYHHRKFGGLRASDLKSTLEIIKAILTIEKITPGQSKFAYFHGEIHLILSQIKFNEGDFAESAWQQELSSYLARPTEALDECRTLLAKAVRVGRLAQLTDQQQYLEELMLLSPDVKTRETATLKLLRSYRISGDQSQYEALFKLADSQIGGMNTELAIEFKWERSCAELVFNKNEVPMLNLLRKKEFQESSDYTAEAYLWTFAQTGRPHQQLLKYSSFRKKFPPPTTAQQALSHIYRILDECQEGAAPMALRITRIGELIAISRSIISLELEMLTLIGVSKWLLKRKASAFANLSLGRYRMLSLSATNGRNADALNLTENISCNQKSTDCENRGNGDFASYFKISS